MERHTQAGYDTNIEQHYDAAVDRLFRNFYESEDEVREHMISPTRKVHPIEVPQSSGENAICEPCVLKDADCYRMWFCGSGEKYGTQHAVSRDGSTWTRLGRDEGIDVSADGWDSDMPCVFDHGGRRFLLYAGNDFGNTGFGLAVQEA
jgi:hypothetical protein